MEESYNYDNYDNYDVPGKSTFVTVVAVVFIVLAGFSLLAVLAQTVLFPSLFHNAETAAKMQEQIDNGNMPSFVGFIYTHRYIFMSISFVLAVVGLISSIGLLMRKNWARIIFIVLMSYRIVSAIFGIGMQLFITPRLPDNVTQSSAQFITTMMMVIRVFSFLFAAGLCILYGWIIAKLLSQKIRMEFHTQFEPEEY